MPDDGEDAPQGTGGTSGEVQGENGGERLPTRFFGMGDNLGDNYFLAQRPKNARHVGNTAHNAKNLSKIMGDNWVIILQRKR